MLVENLIAATEAVNKPSANISNALKDVGIFQYEFQPQSTYRKGFKKSSTKPQCLAISDSHIFAAQANKSVINIYSREKGNQEATVPLPDRIHSLAFVPRAQILVIGTEDGKLTLWETLTGRMSVSASSHLEPVSSLAITKDNQLILSGSPDSSVHVWSLGQLVSIVRPTSSYNDTFTHDEPLRTFSHHRAGITALAVGHSTTSTNFVVSAAADRTCYLWHIESCQVLRTVLTSSTPISVVLDPVDRTIYLGNEDGAIQSIDLFDATSSKGRRAIYDHPEPSPIQVRVEDSWKAPSSDVGAASCLALSYDGTTLLSGHTGGSIIRWDVAKHRVVSEFANMQQPISNIQMTVPDGLRHEEGNFTVSSIVKPRLELNIPSADGTIGVPTSYSLSLQVTKPSLVSSHSNDIEAALSGELFSDSMLDDAIQAMNAKSAGISDSNSNLNGTGHKNDKYKVQALEEEKLHLEKKLAVLKKVYDDAQERHLKRNERRELIGRQRREAYVAAKKKGKDGDAAMKPYEKKLETIDIESDEEELGNHNEMEVDG